MKLLLKGLQYRPDAPFCFTGYTEKEGTQKLISYIISKTLDTEGIQLLFGINNNTPNQTCKYTSSPSNLYL